ncbi:hypothetical protein BU17DRAFT_60907 [Hysterangium stoloniferum]|nr:hypothetical protein BU17DRAFT_60907 [Hysterangium stoloniferum]
MDTTSHTIVVAETDEDRCSFLKALPRLKLHELPADSEQPDELAGVTKLRCGHIFCVADIHEWVNTSRGSCPTCRDVFLIMPEPSDDESSDGGEYIPGSDSIRDDLMDGDTWTDEEVDAWTDMEDISLEGDLEEGDTSSSWGRSSDENAPDDVDAPAAEHLLLPMDSAMITGTSAEASQNEPIGTMVIASSSMLIRRAP